jgi:outer membrane protein OmpA-like peptidoglycan-associated protein
MAPPAAQALPARPPAPGSPEAQLASSAPPPPAVHPPVETAAPPPPVVPPAPPPVAPAPPATPSVAAITGPATDKPHPPSGVLPLPAEGAPAGKSSFQVASLTFGEGTTAVSPEDLKRLKEVYQLYQQQANGSIRILGHSSSARLDPDWAANREANRQLALRRADAVANALIRLGVPARKIAAGAMVDSTAGDPTGAGDLTEIYIDY